MLGSKGQGQGHETQNNLTGVGRGALVNVGVF